MANDEEYRIEVQSEDEFAAVVDKFEDPLAYLQKCRMGVEKWDLKTILKDMGKLTFF